MTGNDEEPVKREPLLEQCWLPPVLFFLIAIVAMLIWLSECDGAEVLLFHQIPILP